MTQVLSVQEYKDLIAKKSKKKNKYGAVKSYYNGVCYDSKGEAECAVYLDLMLKAGELVDIKRQVKIRLDALTIKIDWVITLKTGEKVGVEFKGKELQRFKDIRKMWKAHGPFDMWIFKKQGKQMVKEVLVPNK